MRIRSSFVLKISMLLVLVGSAVVFASADIFSCQKYFFKMDFLNSLSEQEDEAVTQLALHYAKIMIPSVSAGSLDVPALKSQLNSTLLELARRLRNRGISNSVSLVRAVFLERTRSILAQQNLEATNELIVNRRQLLETQKKIYSLLEKYQAKDLNELFFHLCRQRQTSPFIDLILQNIDFLLANGADVNARDPSGKTALVMAAELNDVEFVEFLLKKKARPDFVEQATPPLHVTTNVQIVELLLNAGANVNSTDRKGRTAVMRAISSRSLKILKILLSAGADVNRQDAGDMNRTALIIAAQNRSKDTVEILLQHQADVNLRDRYGKRALSYARQILKESKVNSWPGNKFMVKEARGVKKLLKKADNFDLKNIFLDIVAWFKNGF